MSFMFCGCTSLKELNISNLNIKNNRNNKNMFYKCPIKNKNKAQKKRIR